MMMTNQGNIGRMITHNEFQSIVGMIQKVAEKYNSSFEETAADFIDMLIPTLDGEITTQSGNRETYWKKLKFIMNSYLENNKGKKLFQQQERTSKQ